jgi:O-antigen ligase
MPAIFWTLVVTVLLAPLPLGAIDPWSWGLLGCVTAALMLAWAVRVSTVRFETFVPLRAIWPAAALFGIAAVWIVVQMAGWTPPSWHHPNWGLVAQLLGRETSGSISINPFETGSALFRLLTFAGIFWLSMQLCRSRDRARAVVYSVAVAAFIYSAYGLVAHLSGGTKILWIEKEYYRDSLTSTFFYKNAFATFAGLGLICTTALLINIVEKEPSKDVGRRERTRLFVARLLNQGWSPAMAMVVSGSALLLSNSRGGLVATLVGLGVLFALTFRLRRSKGGYANWMAGAAALLLVGIIGIGGGRVLDRMGDAATRGDVRSQLYELSLAALENDPWRGTGYGTFADTIQSYRTADITRPIVRAHNTYLDNAVELGIPAAVALTLGIGWFAMLCGRGFRRRNRDTIFPRIGLAAASLVAVHATMDFTLEVPAGTATFCLLMGCAVAQSWRGKEWQVDAGSSSQPSSQARISTQQV